MSQDKYAIEFISLDSDGFDIDIHQETFKTYKELSLALADLRNSFIINRAAGEFMNWKANIFKIGVREPVKTLTYYHNDEFTKGSSHEE